MRPNTGSRASTAPTQGLGGTQPSASRWECLGSDKEIVDARIVDNRPRMRIHFTRPREHFVSRQSDLKLSNREALECATDVRPFTDPTYELMKLEHEIAIQAVPERKDNAAQTPWQRKVQMAVQVQPTVTDVRRDLSKDHLSPEDRAALPGVSSALRNIAPRVLHNLVQNELVPLFQDDYATLNEGDSFVGHKEEALLKESQSFVHHKYTKGKRVSSIDWQPKGGRVAISITEVIPWEERLALNRKVLNSMVVIWAFSDPIHPQLVLTAPSEVTVVKFNPTQPQYLAGGCVNGQVCLWDIGKAQETAKSKRKKTIVPSSGLPQAAEGDERDGDREDDAAILRIKWTQASKVETGHKRAVNDLWWLQDGLETNFDGKLVPATGEPCQFATLSSDGFFVIWDTRKDRIRKDKLRKTQQEARGNFTGEFPWIPLHRVQLTKVDGTGDVAGLRMFMECKQIDPYRLCCTTEDGEFVVANWAQLDDKSKDIPIAMEFGQTEKENRTPIKSVAQGHFGLAPAIHRHPFKDELAPYYLTVGDWTFKIWHMDMPTPIVASPSHTSHITCGRWSPTRPSILFVGTSDGFIQIWDLLDRSHEPTNVQSVCQCAITSMEFRPLEGRRSNRAAQQLLAVGDDAGVLHIFEVEGILVRPNANEQRNMQKYLERESKRAAYFAARWKIRQKEFEELQARLQAEKLELQLNQPLDDGKSLSPAPEAAIEDNPFADDIAFNDAREEFLSKLREMQEG
eukprot:TRINITY_DN3889_c0_g1_i1.p1 TRINITY_DN3889_c0_g1~~TRINITY_DN3889_c0_g1_i1.p1  ORF type:complete len:754 (-),score=118.02 TRINITY_DN3889_c0_g1_i1:32-2254(-)